MRGSLFLRSAVQWLFDPVTWGYCNTWVFSHTFTKSKSAKVLKNVWIDVDEMICTQSVVAIQMTSNKLEVWLLLSSSDPFLQHARGGKSPDDAWGANCQHLEHALLWLQDAEKRKTPSGFAIVVVSLDYMSQFQGRRPFQNEQSVALDPLKVSVNIAPSTDIKDTHQNWIDSHRIVHASLHAWVKHWLVNQACPLFQPIWRLSY